MSLHTPDWDQVPHQSSEAFEELYRVWVKYLGGLSLSMQDILNTEGLVGVVYGLSSNAVMDIGTQALNEALAEDPINTFWHS